MTKREISKLLGYSFTFINYQFVENEKKHTELLDKKGKSNKVKTIDYSLDDCKKALTWLTPMEMQYLEEHFVERDSVYMDSRKKEVKLSRDCKHFIKLYNSGEKPEVCATCEYIVPRKMNHIGSKFHPYCSFYRRFLNKTKDGFNVYKDRCMTYLQSERQPFLWEPNTPVNKEINNLDQSILGYDPKELISKRRKGDPIVLLVD